MEIAEVISLVARGESETLELKKSTAEAVDGMRGLCAMANHKGGFLLIGVSPDASRPARDRIVGQDVSEGTLRDLGNELRKFEPPLSYDIIRVPVEGRRAVLVVSVPGGGGPFVYDGRPYRKLGSTKERMPQEQYERLLAERRHGTARWETMRAPRVTVADLDHEELVITVEEAIRRGRLADPGTREPTRLLAGLGLVQDGALLNAAVVLFAREHALLTDYPQCVLRLARFRGRDKAEFLDNRQQLGNAFTLFQAAQRFMIEHLPVAGRILPGIFERQDDPLYPPEALREAIANAIIHRDYATAGGSIALAIYRDRLEIASVGPLPFGQHAGDLIGPHTSRPWNPLIAKVFYLRGLIETWGRGTNRIRDLVEASGTSSVDFQSTRHEVTVVFRPVGLESLLLPRPESGLESGLESRPKSESGLESRPESEGRPMSGLESGLESGPESRPESELRPKSGLESGLTARPPDSRPRSTGTDSLERKVLEVLEAGPLSRLEIAMATGLKRISGGINRLLPALRLDGLIEWTLQEKPNSRLQKYRITEAGRARLEELKRKS